MRSLLLVLVLILPALPARATCGGGGGGGGGGAASNPYKATWTGWDEALKKGQPILLYHQTKPSEHPTLCCTKTSEELSKQYSYVKIPFAKNPKDLSPAEQELLKTYAFDRKPALLVICDAYGNEMTRVSSGLTEPKLLPLFQEAKAESKKLELKLQKMLEKARALDEKGDLAKAYAAFQEVLKHRGGPAVDEARKAVSDVLDKVRARIAELTAEGADPAAGLKTLGEWQKAFKNTELEEPLRDAVQTLKDRAKSAP